MSLAIQNRNNSFFENEEKLSLRRRTVYRLIKTYGFISAQQLRDKMKLGINQVSGRITELKRMCLIKEVGDVTNPKTGTKNTLYSVTTFNERKVLKEKRVKELLERKKSLLENDEITTSLVIKNFIKKELKKVEKQLKDLEIV